MRFRFLFFFIPALLIFNSVFAQDVSSLIRSAETSRSDSVRAVAYRSLIEHYHFSDMDSALYWARTGISFTREINDVRQEALMTTLMGQILERHGVMSQAREQYVQALELFRAIGDIPGIASTTNGLGVVAGRTGKYDEATRHFLEALALYEQIDSRAGMVQALIKLGVVNDHMGNLDRALDYYLRAETLNTEMGSSVAGLTLLNNIGIIYGRRNDLRQALSYFSRGLREADSAKNTGVYIILLGSMGTAYEKIGKPDSAWYYQQRALTMARRNHLPEEESRSLVNLSALVHKSNPQQSLEFLQDALEIAQRINHLMLMTEIYESMIALYKEQNQYKLAMELTEKRQQIKDSIFSVEKSREIANLQATQELARQEDEIRHLALQNEKSVFQRNIMVGIAIAAVAMILVVWFYNTRISNLNTELLKKQLELRNSNNIKDKLFSVLGHDLRAPLNRVIGLLNLLALKHEDQEESAIIVKLKQQSQSTLETLDNLLMWGQNQLKGIRLNQQTLHATDHIGKCIFLTDNYAVQKGVELINDVQPHIYVYADPSHFDFVMRNLLSNAVKFSHSGGAVNIEAREMENGEEIVFSISDSGIGIPKNQIGKIFTALTESVKGTWNEKGTGIGLMLCHEYINQNGGRLWVESEEGTGSTFYFSLKKEKVATPEKEPTPQLV